MIEKRELSRQSALETPLGLRTLEKSTISPPTARGNSLRTAGNWVKRRQIWCIQGVFLGSID
jgi:hypothetical protein